MAEPTHKYVGRFMPDWHGRRCWIVNTWRRILPGRRPAGPHNVRIEFEDGERAVCPIRCLRKLKTDG